nr:ead/Ea22-like family protein [Klebsiella pneumoniae]
MTTDITELAQRNELLIANGQQTADLLRHLADNEIDSDYFAVVSECESYGKETDAELSITEFALRAAGYVDALVEALEYYKSREERVTSLVRDNSKSWDELYRQVEAKGKRNVELVDELEKAQQRIAELESRTVKLSPELYTIGDLIRTQDNRITDQPMFVVFQKREIIGSDEHSPSRICWVWDGEEVSELRAKRLEALYQDGRDTRGYDRYAMQEVDEFVTACFTEHGCKDYLRQNGHNLRLPYIYACGSFRNNEYQLVRNWLAGIKVEAE